MRPPSIYGSLDPPDSAAQTASQSAQPFLHSSRQGVLILYHRPPFTPQNCPFAWDLVPLAHPTLHPKLHVDWFNCFCTAHGGDKTDRPCYSVCSNRPTLHSTAMWPNKAEGVMYANVA